MINIYPKILIIPDVHGRTFWKSAIDQFPYDLYPDLVIIFLGDYLDPYTGYEDITPKDAYENFLEILDYAKKDNRIELLIGNHDWHYFVNLDTCRLDRARSRDIEKLFINNLQKFRLSKIHEVNGINFLFSHAGYTNGFLHDISDLALSEIQRWNPGNIDPSKDEKYQWILKVSQIRQTLDFEIFEKCLQNYDDPFYSCIPSMVSRYRGGWNNSGSMIWADIHEHMEHIYHIKEFDEKYYQIFAHTISFPNNSQYDYYIGQFYAMLDASQAFIINNEGTIKLLNDKNYEK